MRGQAAAPKTALLPSVLSSALRHADIERLHSGWPETDARERVLMGCARQADGCPKILTDSEVCLVFPTPPQLSG
jgi:hypothetical protein